MRINKFLATTGLASRRKCEQYVLEGKVSVNGNIVTNLATNIDEKKDVVMVNGFEVRLTPKYQYLMMHKPKGYICTNRDPKGRKSIFALLEEYKGTRLFSVGRLDYDTEGLLLITNDGDLSHVLTHPSHEIEKAYLAKIEGELTEDEKNKLESGIELDKGFVTSPSKVTIAGKDGKFTKVEIVIHEGKNRQVRKMFEAVGHKVTFLKRVRFGNLKLGGLARGKVRELRQSEIAYLKTLN